MNVSLFVYGTLLDRDLLELVCEQPVDQFVRKQATLPGFEPRYVTGKHFPVLVIAPTSSTTGEIIEFDEPLMQRLHAYEREDFELCEVSVKLDDNTECNCHYFANVGYTKISDKRWSLEEFQLLHKADFLKHLGRA